MEKNGAVSAKQLHCGNAFKTPNPNKPTGKAAIVSAAGPSKARKLDTPLQPISHSAKKSTVKKQNKRKHEEEQHPLAVTFKGSLLSLLAKHE